jgi:hypothetical protein
MALCYADLDVAFMAEYPYILTQTDYVILLLQIQELLQECLIYLCLGFLVFHCFKSYQFTELLVLSKL